MRSRARVPVSYVLAGEAPELRTEIPLGRPGTTEEVASAVAWLVSEEASYVTGASFLIDDGMAQQVVERPA